MGDRPAAGQSVCAPEPGGYAVKANLARFTLALVSLASVALTLAAGVRWN